MIIYLFAKFRASLLFRPMYSPKIGIVGLWAFWGLSLVQIFYTLSQAMPKLDCILYFTTIQNFDKVPNNFLKILFSCLRKIHGGVYA